MAEPEDTGDTGTTEAPATPVTRADGVVIVDEHGRLVGPDESRQFGVPSTWRR